MFFEYGDYRDWIIGLLGVGCIFMLIIFVWAFGFDPFTKLSVTPEGITRKTLFAMTSMPWCSVLGVKILKTDEVFQIVGIDRQLVFNSTDFVDSSILANHVKANLSGYFEQPSPSANDETLITFIERILDLYPEDSPSKIFGRILPLDTKVRYKRVKELTESIKERKQTTSNQSA